MDLEEADDMPHWAIEILAYFVANPSAADSLDGIARWRLAEVLTQRHVANVEAALMWLVARHYLVEETATAAAPIFRLDARHAAEARALLGRVDVRSSQTSGGGPSGSPCQNR